MDTHAHPVIFIVSDGRGETCRQLLRAALVQYDDQQVEIILRPDVLTRELVAAVVSEAARREAVIFYTLVGDETRRAITRFCGEQLVPAVDVLGPALTALYDVMGQAPAATPGLFYAAERVRIEREAAVDYTLKHDDGLRAHELKLADVVLVGVSRVCKSTTCFYLAYNGIKAANVPLVHGTPHSRHLLELDPEKVIGLRMNTTRLMAVRDARARHLGQHGTETYVDKRRIGEEILAAQALMQRQGWRSFDASYMAVEEIAREVMRLRGLARSEDD